MPDTTISSFLRINLKMASSSHTRPSILWLQDDNLASMDKIEDKSWALTYTHNAMDGSTVTAKAGNKHYVLSNSTESKVVQDRRVTAEATLYKNYR